MTVDTRTNMLIVKDIAREHREGARAGAQPGHADAAGAHREPHRRGEHHLQPRSSACSGAAARSLRRPPATPPASSSPTRSRVTGGSPRLGARRRLRGRPNFAVNLPAAVGRGAGGALGFAFGSAGGALQLNLRLSAAENEGTVKTISAPKVTTLDNNTARISQGVSIPVQPGVGAAA